MSTQDIEWLISRIDEDLKLGIECITSFGLLDREYLNVIFGLNENEQSLIIELYKNQN